MCILYRVLTLPSHFTRRAVVIFNVFRCLGQFCDIVVVYYNFSCCSRFISDLSWRETTKLAYTNLFTMLRLSVHLSHCTIVSERRKQLNLWNRSSPSGSNTNLHAWMGSRTAYIRPRLLVFEAKACLLACLLVSFLIAEGQRSFRAPAVSIVACPAPTLNTLPLICLTSPWYHLSIFASACLVFSSHQFYLPVFRCTDFWLWPHDQNTEAYVSVQLPAVVPVVVFVAAQMY